MAKKKKDRKISETERTFYRLGFLNGEQRLERTIKLLRTTNGMLWDELVRLDRDKPITGVILNYDMFARVVKALRETPQNHRALVKTLNKMKREAQKNDNNAALLSLKHIVESIPG